MQTLSTIPAGASKLPQHQRFGHILELDGLRGIAVLLVFFHHVCFILPAEGWGNPFMAIYRVAAYGYTGVSLFFALSGFLITSLLIEDRAKPHFYKSFYWKRALRILPLYAVCLLGILLFIPGSKSWVLLCVLFIANFASIFHVSFVGPFWSLSVEEQFYLIWPTVVHRRSPRELKRWALGIIGAAILLRLLFAAFGHHNYYVTFLCCDGLAFGALLACWYRERTAAPAELRRETRWIFGGLLAAVLLLALGNLPDTGPRSEALLDALFATGISFLFAACFALILKRQGSPGLSLLRSRALQFFGLISYAMYMIHAFVLFGYDALRGPLVPNDYRAYLLRIVVVLAVTVALSLVSRYLIELPAANLRKYVLPRSEQRLATTQLPIEGIVEPELFSDATEPDSPRRNVEATAPYHPERPNLAGRRYQ